VSSSRTMAPRELPPGVMSEVFSLAAVPGIQLRSLLSSILESAITVTGADAGGAIFVPGGKSQQIHWSLKEVAEGPMRPQGNLVEEWAARALPSSGFNGDNNVPGVRIDTSNNSSFRLFPGSRCLAQVPIPVGEPSPGRLQVETFQRRALSDRQLRSLAELGRFARTAICRLLLRDRAMADGLDLQVVGKSPKLLELERQLELVAQDSRNPALIYGERGSGKELAAYSIHFFSRRRYQPYIPANCAAFSESLVADAFFGHQRGAFTGADGVRRGLFQAARGGTLFLDEIGDMPLTVQAALLRALDRGEIRQMGSDKPSRIDVRIIAATNHDLEERIREGSFRRDLYDRLQVFPVRVPPLRERKADIPLLAEHFLRKACQNNGRNQWLGRPRVCRGCGQAAGHVCIDPALFDLLAEHDFPGNVRELRNLMYRLSATVAEEVLKPKHAFPQLRRAAPTQDSGPEDLRLDSVIRRHIAAVVELTGGNKAQAARLLGLPPTTLFNKMKKLGLH
jgi:transcriptional regulator with GAF, ATPase, and Fis domain